MGLLVAGFTRTEIWRPPKMDLARGMGNFTVESFGPQVFSSLISMVNAWYTKHAFSFNGCFSWMSPNLYKKLVVSLNIH